MNNQNTPNDPIVELHDIGKIVDKKSIKDSSGTEIKMYGHSFLNLTALKAANPLIKEPTNRPLTWTIINHHHYGEVGEYNKDNKKDISIPQMVYCKDEETKRTARHLILAQLADSMASSFRIEQEGKGGTVDGKEYFRLWKHKKGEANRKDVPLIQFDKLPDLLNAIDDVKNSSEDVICKYRDLLGKVPEDKTSPRNIISLYTHMELSGRFYKLFDSAYTDEDIAKYYSTEARYRCMGIIGHCRVHFPHYIYKPEDLSLFNLINNEIETIYRECPSVIFTNAPDFYFFIPISKSEKIPVSYQNGDCNYCAMKEKIECKISAAGFCERFTQKGFSLRTTVVYDCLYYITSTPEDLIQAYAHNACPRGTSIPIEYLTDAEFDKKVKCGDWKLPQDSKELEKSRKTFKRKYEKDVSEPVPAQRHFEYNFQPAMKHTIVPTSDNQLCEVCQQQEAKKKFNNQGKVEFVCNVCEDYIRGNNRYNQIFANLKEWQKKPNPPRFAWIKIDLDMEKLIKSLNTLFDDYRTTNTQQRSTLQTVEKEEKLNTALIKEFLQDYQCFLKQFEDKIQLEKTKLTRDYFVINLGNDYIRIIDILNQFLKLMDEYFPRFKDPMLLSSPLRLIISTANAKHPFFDHWNIYKRAIQDFHGDKKGFDIHINLVTSGVFYGKIARLEKLMAFAEGKPSKKEKWRKDIPTALHRLAEISRLSEELARSIAFHQTKKDDGERVSKEEKDIRSVFERLGRTPMADFGISGFSDLLTFSKIFAKKRVS